MTAPREHQRQDWASHLGSSRWWPDWARQLGSSRRTLSPVEHPKKNSPQKALGSAFSSDTRGCRRQSAPRTGRKVSRMPNRAIGRSLRCKAARHQGLRDVKPLPEPESILVQIGSDPPDAPTSARGSSRSRIAFGRPGGCRLSRASSVRGCRLRLGASKRLSSKPPIKPSPEPESILVQAGSEASDVSTERIRELFARPSPEPESILVQAGSQAPDAPTSARSPRGIALGSTRGC